MDLKNLKLQGTVINYFPFPFDTVKPGLVPALYQIPAGDPIRKDFSIFQVDSVISRTYVGELGGGWRESLCPASELCESIVNDFFTSCIYTEQATRIGPGITWIEGLWNKEDIPTAKDSKGNPFAPILEDTYNKQVEWFKILVQHADDSWAKVRQHRVLSDLQRYAASFLKLDREWLTALEIKKTQHVCDACGTMVPLTAIKCFNCGYILDIKKFEEIKHRFDMAGAVTTKTA